MWSPLGNEPMLQTARWQPEPATRGTFSIISTCLTTLVLCSWTVIHVNIPSNRMRRRGIWHKVWWFILGLFLPEVVAMTAYKQWLSHRTITKVMKRSLERLGPIARQDTGLEANDSGRNSHMLEDLELLPVQTAQERFKTYRRYNWTALHSFYALMGGFVFDNSHNEESHALHGERVAIHQTLLEWLAENEPDIIPDISPKHIADKSKANGLAKLLVCIQAGWFGLQILTRLSQGFAVTLLELNVFAHVVCALLAYIFWWGKPLDIDEPTAIYTKDLKAGSILAALLSKTSPAPDTPLVVRRRGQAINERMKDVQGKGVSVGMVLNHRTTAALWSQCFGSGSNAPQHATRYVPNQGYIFEDVPMRLFTSSLDHDRNSDDQILIELDGVAVKAELERLEFNLHPQALGPDDHVYASFETGYLKLLLFAHRHPAGLKIIGLDSKASMFDYELKPRIRAWSYFDLKKNAHAGLVEQMSIFTTSNLLYGAWHLMSWNGPFRTEAEGTLWKVSAVGVSSSSILAFTNGYFMKWVQSFEAALINRTRGLKAIRLFVESFISLAFVPDSVFAVPGWSNYLPHIS